jgi:hypothetical protein
MAKRASLGGLLLVVVLLLLAFAAGWVVARTGAGMAADPATLNDREREFADRMTGSSLIGQFTVDGRETEAGRADRYDLERVQKVGDNLWQFTARIGDSGLSAAIPLAVPMQWVGDTPLIVLTDFGVPGMGSFTARVFFHGDRYAGTWQSARAGGHMFGRIVPAGSQFEPDVPPAGR